MKVAHVTLKSASPYSQSKHHSTPKLEKEGDDNYEKRTWRERLHYDKEGAIFIPPMAFKNCLSECAKFISMKIPGRKSSTYTKHFEAGILVQDTLPVGLNKKDAIGEEFFVPADGVRGSGKRVWKTFPMVPHWTGTIPVYVLDETITEDVFREHIIQAGRFIGVGRFRPRNNGYYGRFDLVKMTWGEFTT